MNFNSRPVGGQHNPQAKLLDEYRVCIRLAKGQVPTARLAKIYGVSQRTILDQWAKVPEPRP